MSQSESVYEARYGWTPRTLRLVILCALAVCGVLLLDPGQDSRYLGMSIPNIVVQVLGVALFGLGGLSLTYAAVTRKVALRVDAQGILLGGSPMRYRATTALVPWAEVTGVELWIQEMSTAFRTLKMPYVGVHRVPGSLPLAGPSTGATARMGSALTGVSPELVNASRGVVGWPLERARLLEAVRQHAPEAAVTVNPDFPATR